MNTNLKEGFTLIDLILAMAIIGIVLSVGLPSFNNVLTNTHLTNYANEMVRALNIARSESAKQHYRVTMCKSSSETQACDNARDWKDGWIVFVDKNNDRVLDVGESVILVAGALKTGYYYNTSYTNYIYYRPDGRSNTNGNFRICSPNDGSASFRKIVISDTGRIRTLNDTNRNYDNDTYSSVC